MTTSFKNTLNGIQLKPFEDLGLNLFINKMLFQNNKFITDSSEEKLLLKSEVGLPNIPSYYPPSLFSLFIETIWHKCRRMWLHSLWL